MSNICVAFENLNPVKSIELNFLRKKWKFMSFVKKVFFTNLRSFTNLKYDFISDMFRK